MMTISYSGKSATDLGYLLHKSSFRVHSFEQVFGKTHVFYPETTPERCTVALAGISKRNIQSGKTEKLFLVLFAVRTDSVRTVSERPYLVKEHRRGKKSEKIIVLVRFLIGVSRTQVVISLSD